MCPLLYAYAYNICIYYCLSAINFEYPLHDFPCYCLTHDPWSRDVYPTSKSCWVPLYSRLLLKFCRWEWLGLWLLLPRRCRRRGWVVAVRSWLVLVMFVGWALPTLLLGFKMCSAVYSSLPLLEPELKLALCLIMFVESLRVNCNLAALILKHFKSIPLNSWSVIWSL